MAAPTMIALLVLNLMALGANSIEIRQVHGVDHSRALLASELGRRR